MIVRCLLLALLCLVAYAPTLTIPLVEDDYPNIGIAQTYGTPAGLPLLLKNPVLRPRATSWWIMYASWRNFQTAPLGYHVAALLLHIANTILVYWLALLWRPMRDAAIWAAAFFAVHEGHQEAVMWLSGMTDAFLFFFGIAAVLCWMAAETRKHGWLWRIAALVLYVFALLSKESAVVLLPFFVLTAPKPFSRSFLIRLTPVLAITALAVASTLATQAYSFRSPQITIHAPFWITWPRSFLRLLWAWGWFGMAVIFLQKSDRDSKRSAVLALLWIGIGLAPYSFLGFPYSTQIASRQTYLASAGLALLFGLAVAHLAAHAPKPRLVVAAVVGLMLINNVGWIWTRKRAQFLARAEPTEQLIRLAKQTSGPIWMRCFPRQQIVAEDAVRLGAGKPISTLLWNEPDAALRRQVAEFCYEEPGARSKKP